MAARLFIAVSMIGPVRSSLLSYADAVISAGLGVVVLSQALTLLPTLRTRLFPAPYRRL